MGFGPAALPEPDNFLSNPHAVGEPRNRSHVNDPALNDMLARQRRTIDVGKRRELIHEIQRYLARQQYYVHTPAGIYIGVWDRALKNYGPNLGFDYGAAWSPPASTASESR
jgi:ABC-type transport system substrate-binding protein